MLSSAGTFLLKAAVFFSLLSQTTFSFLHLEMFDSSSAETCQGEENLNLSVVVNKKTNVSINPRPW